MQSPHEKTKQQIRHLHARGMSASGIAARLGWRLEDVRRVLAPITCETRADGREAAELIRQRIESNTAANHRRSVEEAA